MSDSEDDDFPKVVWTFPLVRRVQSGRLLNIGSGIGSILGQSIGSSLSSSSSDDSDYSQEVESEAETINNKIDDAKDESADVFSDFAEDVNEMGDEDSSTHTIDIVSGAFIPQRTMVDVGDTVVWDNTDDESHNVMSISGEDINETLEVGDVFEHTFDEEGVTIFIDSVVGGSNMSGAVIVGDAELERELPSERDVERQLFDESSSKSRSMSEAAEDKQNLVDEVRE